MVKDAWLPLACSVLACFLVWWGSGYVQWGTDTNSPTHTVNRLVASISGQPHLVESDGQSSAVPVVATEDTLALIDVPGISQETLGKHWAQLTSTEQDEFMALFAQLPRVCRGIAVE